MKSSARVVITGVGLISSLAYTLTELMDALIQGKSASCLMPGWDSPALGLQTRVAAPILKFEEQMIDRKVRRTMSRVSMLAMTATAHALEDSKLSEAEIQSERTAISYGSSMGGTSTIEEYFKAYNRSGILSMGLTSTSFLKIMPHTCAANIAISFGIPGRVITSCVACASGTQAIGYGFEAIRSGLVDRAVCGGAEELTPTVAAIFDVLGATSTHYHDSPRLTPKPFDADRDGIVVGEGAGSFILENRDMAIARGAKIYGEIIGFYTNNDAQHMTNPSARGLERCMRGALQDAGLEANDIDYVNAHAAGTSAGDHAEAVATGQIFGDRVPISSCKGHLGHLMGAAGAIETIACLGMLEQQVLIPTLNLQKADDFGLPLDFVIDQVRQQPIKRILKNSFAFGGINASLVIQRIS
ncbi:MAG: beta-ketoacyl-[acyl-carrier-protein] synthase family protein [Proteobacteria bacterium]|nr:beta-ketoacyl-[acyl-carrier-protein] synthase family protein [Pseudomonadota bacterium]